MAEYLISNGADPNLGRNPPLHYAARLGQLRSAQYLLEMGAEVNALNRMGYAELQHATARAWNNVADADARRGLESYLGRPIARCAPPWRASCPRLRRT